MNNFFTNYPDTDFHELNLDWLLNEWQTYREQFDGLITRMDTIEAAFKDLQDFVTNYFDNLDVQDEINNKLNDMFESGELQVLLQRVIDNPQVMDLTPILSVSKYRGYYDRNAEANYPSFQQTACTDGTNMYMFFMNPVSQGDVIIEKRSLSTKELLGSATISGGYHANGSDYYDGNIYLATIQGGIIVINAASLTVSSRHTFDIQFRSVSVDNDGTMYAESYYTLYTVDLTNDTYTRVCDLEFDNQDLQSGIVRDGWLYEAGTNPACMYKINASNGLVSKIYPIDRYIDQYPVGEVESIAHNRVTGMFYIISCAYWGFGNYRLGQVFGCDLTTNTAPRRVYNGGSYQAGGDIYVDESYTGGLPDGSSSKPFSSIAQAVCAIQSPYRLHNGIFTMNLASDCNDDLIYLRGNININITGNGYKVGCVYVRDGKLSMSGVIIDNQFVTGGVVEQRPLYALYARVNLDNVTILAPATAPDNYVAVFNSCVGSVYNLTLPENYYISNYRSDLVINQGLKPYVYYTNDNQPNLSVSQASLPSLTPAQISNVANCDLIILRVVKSSIQTFVQFPVDDSHVAQCFLRIGSNLECYSIASTKVSDGVFRFSVQEARKQTAVETWETTTDPVLAGVYFFSMS